MFFLALFLSSSLFFNACKEEEETENQTEIVIPDNFKVDIPESISFKSAKSGDKGDTLQGNEVYEHLRHFVNIGEFGAQVINDIIKAIKTYHLNQPATFSYVSDDDGRKKDVVIVENTANSADWKYKLTISDADGVALQVLWKSNPVSGTAILNFYNLDHNQTMFKTTMFKVEYAEKTQLYDQQMTVSIMDFDLSSAIFAMDNMKMFVGKKGDLLDIYGNSNHPNMKLIDVNYTGGRNWAFTAHANPVLDIAVAAVALPPSSTETNDNLMTVYSMKNVLMQEITTVYPYIPEALLNEYLSNTNAPGYFKQGIGYISCGNDVPQIEGFTSQFIDLSGLKPYVPKSIKDLVINFE